MMKNAMNRRTFVGVVSMAALVPSIGLSQTIDPKQARVRLNMVSKLGMLAQRTSKAAAFDALGIMSDDMQSQMTTSVSEIATIANGLLNGDETLGTTTEKSVSVQFDIEDFQTAFAPASDAVTTGDGTLEEIINGCDAASQQADRATNTFIDVYVGPSIANPMAATIKILGQRRQMTQEMPMRVALAALDINADANIAELVQNIETFGNLFAALPESAASFGLSRPPNAAASASLAEIIAIWDQQKPVYERIIASGEYDHASLTDILAGSEQLLAVAEELLIAYQDGEIA